MKFDWMLVDGTICYATDRLCDYTAFECGVRNLSPESVGGVYIPGIVALFPGIVALFPLKSNSGGGVKVAAAEVDSSRLHQIVHNDPS